MKSIHIISYMHYRGHKTGLHLIKSELERRILTERKSIRVNLHELEKGQTLPSKLLRLEDGILLSAGKDGFDTIKVLSTSNDKVYVSHKDETFLNEEFKVLKMLYLPNHVILLEPIHKAYEKHFNKGFLVRGDGVPINNPNAKEIQEALLNSEREMGKPLLDPAPNITQHVILNLDGDSEDTQISKRLHFYEPPKNRLFTVEDCRSLIRRLYDLRIIHSTCKVYLRCHPVRTGQFSWVYKLEKAPKKKQDERGEYRYVVKLKVEENKEKGFNSRVYQTACEELDTLGIKYQPYSKDQRPQYNAWYAFAKRKDVVHLVPAVSTTQVMETLNQMTENLILYETNATAKDHFSLSFFINQTYGVPFLTHEALLPKMEAKKLESPLPSPEKVIVEKILELSNLEEQA